MNIIGAAAELAELLAARPRTITTTLGVLDVTTTVVASDAEEATLALSWITSLGTTQGLVIRLDNVGVAIHNAFGESDGVDSLLASRIESAALFIASDLTTYIPPHLDFETVATAVEEMKRHDLFLLPNWEQEIRERILAAEGAVEEDLEARVEYSGAWSIVDRHARRIAQELAEAHPVPVGE